MLKFRTKLSYGVGGISDNALYTLTGTYLLMYLTTVAGVNPSVAGLISAIGSVWEAIVAPIFGAASDRKVSRFGRRKPFILVAAFPLAISTSLLFTAVNAGPGVKAIYYAIMIILFWTFFSMEFIPYLSWGADLTEDYNERTVLRSFSFVFNQVGMLIGMVLPPIIVDYAMNIGKTTAQSWQMVGMFSGVSAMTALLICALTIKKNDIPKSEWKKIKESRVKTKLDKATIKKTFIEFKGVLKLKPIRILIGASMLYLISDMVFCSARVFYMTYNMRESEKTISLMMLIITLTGLALVPLIAMLAQKLDKKTVFGYGIGLGGVIMIAMRFIGVNSIGSLILVGTAFALANTCYWQLMPSMIYDVSEVDELVTGESHSGTVISLQAMSESISIAIGIQGLGIILDLAGFVESELDQPKLALTWLSNSFTFIPGIFMILVFVLMISYPINRKSFDVIMHELTKKRNGLEPDMKRAMKIIK